MPRGGTAASKKDRRRHHPLLLALLSSSAAGSTCFPSRLSIYHLRLQLGPSRVQQRQRQRLLVPVLLPARRFFALPDYPRSSQLQQQSELT